MSSDQENVPSQSSAALTPKEQTSPYCEDYSSVPDLHPFLDNVPEELPSGLVIYPTSIYPDYSLGTKITVTDGIHVLTFRSGLDRSDADKGLWQVITGLTYPLARELRVTIEFKLERGPAHKLRLEARWKNAFGLDAGHSNTAACSEGTEYVRISAGAYPTVFQNGPSGLYVRAVPTVGAYTGNEDQGVQLKSICWSDS